MLLTFRFPYLTYLMLTNYQTLVFSQHSLVCEAYIPISACLQADCQLPATVGTDHVVSAA